MLIFQGCGVGGGQLGDGDEQGPASVGPGETLQRGLHHLRGPGCVEVYHVHVQPGEDGHGPLHRVGDVVELQVQKNLVSPGLDLPDDGGSPGVVQLHADLHEGLFLLEPVQKGQGLLPAVEVQCDDNVLTHDALLL